MIKRGSLEYYADLLSKAKLNSDDLSKKKMLLYRAKILANVKRYQFVQKETGVPWQLIAAIHGLEASFGFGACFANGDPLNKVTTHVPKGRGPFLTWEASAIDELKRHHTDAIDHWTIPLCLQFAERWNGLGVLNKHPGFYSAYLWSFTNLYKGGKYVADGVWDAKAISKQVGVAAVFLDLKQNNLLEIPSV
jgi:lysozyme family protein